MSNKLNKRLNLEFFWSLLRLETMCFSVLGTFPMGWNSSFSWAWPELIPGHWELLWEAPWMLGTLPGPLGSWARLLGPDLAGFSWRSLGKAGQGFWVCLGLGWTLWHSQNTLTHTLAHILKGVLHGPGLTLKVLFLVILGLFELCTFFGSFGTF